VKNVYKSIFKDNWLSEINKTIGDESYNNSLKTMHQRGISSTEEIMSFTNLKDLHTLINSHWQYFQAYFNCLKKEFNTLMSGIIKARTETAHNRPEHLWPKIERDRTKVLCYDLLSKIKSSKTS
ncbi:MAG: hypothetical protein QME64_03410, partial [bacterium]|nr:hypothetical protein [bacterium]